MFRDNYQRFRDLGNFFAILFNYQSRSQSHRVEISLNYRLKLLPLPALSFSGGKKLDKSFSHRDDDDDDDDDRHAARARTAGVVATRLSRRKRGETAGLSDARVTAPASVRPPARAPEPLACLTPNSLILVPLLVEIGRGRGDLYVQQ